MSLSPAPPARHDGHAPGSTSDRTPGRTPALAAVPAERRRPLHRPAAALRAAPAAPSAPASAPTPSCAASTSDVAAGEVVALLGPSGCGKSTLLRSAAGLDRPTEGRVLVGDHEVDGIDHACAVAFQEPRLMPWKSVRENVALGLPAGTTSAEATSRVDELLDLVGLAEHADQAAPRDLRRHGPAHLPGPRPGPPPGVLLLDEPFGALDALTRMRMQDLLLSIHEAAPTTVLLVTHDVDEALQVADRVAVLGRPVARRALRTRARWSTYREPGRGTAAPPTWPRSAPTCSPAWASTPTATDPSRHLPPPRDRTLLAVPLSKGSAMPTAPSRRPLRPGPPVPASPWPPPR